MLLAGGLRPPATARIPFLDNFLDCFDLACVQTNLRGGGADPDHNLPDQVHISLELDNQRLFGQQIRRLAMEQDRAIYHVTAQPVGQRVHLLNGYARVVEFEKAHDAPAPSASQNFIQSATRFLQAQVLDFFNILLRAVDGQRLVSDQVRLLQVRAPRYPVEKR